MSLGQDLRATLVAALLGCVAGSPAAAADYSGPLIDAHSHLSSARAVEAYVEAMKRHNVSRVVLLAVGGEQKDDPAWVAAAARRHPDRVVAGQPLPDPAAEGAAARLDAALEKSRARVVGEVHLRQVGRKAFDRDPSGPSPPSWRSAAGAACPSSSTTS
ncbi:MAG: hypothetical protein HYV93_07220 [Candidatus Rokubacteria bacterium]|nr:hypothetical protein [Candidatus Rokubacteria bacterium]